MSYNLASNTSYGIYCNTKRNQYKLVILKLTEISDDHLSR